MIDALKQKWKVYSMEAVCLGLFMISASVFATILEYPNSLVHQAIPNHLARLAVMSVAMGVTAVGINYSPMGKLSGAHMNPAVTLSFLGLKKIGPWDAFFYVLFQTVGGVLAVTVMSILIGSPFRDSHVNYVVTAPGPAGNGVAFLLEVIMSFCMMAMVLIVSNRSRYATYTGKIAGLFVAVFVLVSAPVSGFSINPARTIASAIPSGMYPAFWIYMTAPFLGMFTATAVYKYLGAKVECAKITHDDKYQCIFDCGFRNPLANGVCLKQREVTQSSTVHIINQGPSARH